MGRFLLYQGWCTTCCLCSASILPPHKCVQQSVPRVCPFYCANKCRLKTNAKNLKSWVSIFAKLCFVFIFLSCKKWRRGQNPLFIRLHNSIMEYRNSNFKAPLIANYAVLFELWGSIELTHRSWCHAIVQPGCHNIQTSHVSVTEPSSPMDYGQSPHRISARGSLLCMRCVSLTLTGLVSAWRREEAPSAILAKPLSDCVTVFCLRRCKSRHFHVCEILKKKNASYFQTNWISCILNWGVRCDVVSDAGHTCCCCSFLLLTFPPTNWRTSLTTKIEVSLRQQI